MKVILMKDLLHCGVRGEEIDVKDGFGRNYLLPQGLALLANVGNRKVFEQQRKEIDAIHARERDVAIAIAGELAGTRITIAKRVGETETLYGSVTPIEIGEALEKKGILIDRRKLDLKGGIKTIGDHPVLVNLHPEVVGEVTVTVVAEE